MQCTHFLALRGPNVWARFPVLEAWVDLQELRDSASNELPGFNQRLRQWLPSLVEHRCSVGERGGFFQRLERGTYLAHILEHVALELQTLAGTEVGFGRTRMTSVDGVYRVAIEYQFEELGRAALETARELCLAAVHARPFDLEGEIDKLRSVARAARPGPVVEALQAAARTRGIPVQPPWAPALIQFGYGAAGRRVFDGQTDRSSAVGNSIAYDRELTRSLLQSAGVPLPDARPASSPEDARAAAREVGLPVVLRPRYANGSGMVTRCLSTEGEVEASYRQAAAEGWDPLVEHTNGGEEYRLLVIGRRVVGVCKQTSSGAELPPPTIHPAVEERAVEAVAALGLEVAGVDLVAADLSVPLEQQGGYVVGVAGQPDLKPYLEDGDRVALALIDHLFPVPRQSRIPIVAVTGTNGKTTTTRLTAHLLGRVHNPVGMCCTEGIYIGSRRIMRGDCSGPRSARAVLQHPEPRAAALEVARGGILREGLGFDRCDVAVITNIGEGDHLGSSDINTTQELAWVKSTVVWTVARHGSAVLNAQDPLVVEMAKYCEGSVVYFARQEDHPVIVAQRRQQGRAAFVRDNSLILAEGDTETPVIDFTDVPLTQGGRVGFHVENALAAAAAAWAVGVPIEEIGAGLRTFSPGMDHVPARFNLLDIDGRTVILDYGHNTSALARVLEVLEKFPHARRAIVYSAAGDRRDSDIVAQGEILGNAFDRVYLYEDTYLRGRPPGEICFLFRQGLARGTRVRDVFDIRGGLAAIETALATSEPGDLIVLQPDLIDDGVTILKGCLNNGGREITLDEALSRPKRLPDAAASASGEGVEIRRNHLGKGVYAVRPFSSGEVILRCWGPTTRERSRFTIQVDHDLHLIPPEPLRYLNHSCVPSCGLLIRTGVEEIQLHALRLVAPGEELTLDYETFETEFRSLTGPCLCGTPVCRGRVVGYRALPVALRETYGVYVAEYLREADVPVLAGPG
jgi:cyanophycin synthetase